MRDKDLNFSISFYKIKAFKREQENNKEKLVEFRLDIVLDRVLKKNPSEIFPKGRIMPIYPNKENSNMLNLRMIESNEEYVALRFDKIYPDEPIATDGIHERIMSLKEKEKGHRYSIYLVIFPPINNDQDYYIMGASKIPRGPIPTQLGSFLNKHEKEFQVIVNPYIIDYASKKVITIEAVTKMVLKLDVLQEFPDDFLKIDEDLFTEIKNVLKAFQERIKNRKGRLPKTDKRRKKSPRYYITLEFAGLEPIWTNEELDKLLDFIELYQLPSNISDLKIKEPKEDEISLLRPRFSQKVETKITIEDGMSIESIEEIERRTIINEIIKIYSENLKLFMTRDEDDKFS